MSRPRLVWRQLVLPIPVDEARVRSFLTALTNHAHREPVGGVRGHRLQRNSLLAHRY